MKNKIMFIFLGTVLLIFLISIITSKTYNMKNTIRTSSTALSNQSIGWGIKRNDNHEQPDLGIKNKKLIEEYSGIAIGNSSDKNIYLTFDEGYEAGYTEKILDILKENNVKAAFFITGHYLNTQPELVKRMIDEGHVVGNHTPKALMSENLNKIKI